MDSDGESTPPPAPSKGNPKTTSTTPPPTPKKLTRAEILEKARAKAKEAHARKSAKSREAKELKAMQEKADELESAQRRRALEARIAKLEDGKQEVQAMDEDGEVTPSPPPKQHPKAAAGKRPQKRVRIEKEASPEEDDQYVAREHVPRRMTDAEIAQLEGDRAAYHAEIMRIKNEALHRKLFKFLK